MENHSGTLVESSLGGQFDLAIYHWTIDNYYTSMISKQFCTCPTTAYSKLYLRINFVVSDMRQHQRISRVQDTNDSYFFFFSS